MITLAPLPFGDDAKVRIRYGSIDLTIYGATSLNDAMILAASGKGKVKVTNHTIHKSIRLSGAAALAAVRKGLKMVKTGL
jgi:hypothetical protein